MELEGYSRPACNKLVHSAMSRSTAVGVIHKLTVDEFVDCTNTPNTCCGKIFEVQNVEITRVTLTTSTQGTVSHHKANTSHCRPIYKSNPIQCEQTAQGKLPFACIFNNITYKLKHLQFQLTLNENCKQCLDQASVCLDCF